MSTNPLLAVFVVAAAIGVTTSACTDTDQARHDRVVKVFPGEPPAHKPYIPATTVSPPTTVAALGGTAPTTTTGAPSPSLGVTRNEVVAYWGAALHGGYRFEPGEPIRGSSQVIGMSDDGRSVVQVIGDPVVEVSLSLTKADDGSFQDLTARRLVVLYAPAAEDWWWSQNERTLDTRDTFDPTFTATTQLRDRVVEIDFNYAVGVYVTTIRVAS